MNADERRSRRKANLRSSAFICVPLFFFWLVLAPCMRAQTIQLPRVGELRFSAGIQLTGIYTSGGQGDINGDRWLEPVDNRFDFGARRARFSVSGRVTEGLDLDFRVVFYYDNLGRDRFTGTRTTPSDGTVGVWDAFWMWHAQPTWANFTIGYFRPQIGRENMTSGFQTNSNMDKLPTQVYQRAHTVGRSSGREMGLNWGGLRNRSKWGVNYNVGLFDTSHQAVTGQIYGSAHWSPLVVSRVAVSLGQPEMPSYGIDYQINYFNRRKGVTVAAAYATQGQTDVFLRNETLNFDVLANYAGLNLDAEFDLLRRHSTLPVQYTDRVWHIRSGYNIRAPHGTWLEPVVAYMRFRGDRMSVLYPNGRDRVLDMGLNWYVRETRVKLNVHCTRQAGSGISNLSDQSTFLRGNMVGLGVQLVY